MLKLFKLVLLFYSIIKLTNGTFWFGKEFDQYLDAYENNYNDDSLTPMLKTLAIYKRKLQLLGLYPVVRTTGLAYMQSDYDVFDIEDEYDDYIYGLLNQPKLTPRYKNGYQPNAERRPTLPPTKSPPTRRPKKKLRKTTTERLIPIVTSTTLPPPPPPQQHAIISSLPIAASSHLPPPPPPPPPPPAQTIQNNWVVIMPNGQPYKPQNPTGNGVLCERNGDINGGKPCATDPDQLIQVDKDGFIRNPLVPVRNTTTTTRRTTTPRTTTTRRTTTTTTKRPTTTTHHPYKFNTTYYLPLKTMPTKKIPNFELSGKDSVRPSYLSTNRPYSMSAAAANKIPAKIPISSSNNDGGTSIIEPAKQKQSQGPIDSIKKNPQSFYVSNKPTTIHHEPITTTIKYESTAHYTAPRPQSTTTEYPHITTTSNIIGTLVNLFIPEKITTKKPIIQHHKPSYLSTQLPYVTANRPATIQPHEPHQHSQKPTVTVTKIPQKVVVQIELDHENDSNNSTVELPRNTDATDRNATKTISLLMGILGGKKEKPTPPPTTQAPDKIEHHIEENIYVELPPQHVIYSHGGSSTESYAKSNISNEKSNIPTLTNEITITPMNIQISERNAKATTEISETITDHKSYSTTTHTTTTEHPKTTEYHKTTKHPITSTTSYNHHTSYTTISPTTLPPKKPLLVKPTLIPMPYLPLKPIKPISATIKPTTHSPIIVSKPATDYPVMTVTISINHKEAPPPFRDPVGAKVTSNASVHPEQYTESYKNSETNKINTDFISASSPLSTGDRILSTPAAIVTADILTTTGLYEWDIDPKMNNESIPVTETEDSRTINPNVYIEETRPQMIDDNDDLNNVIEESLIVTTEVASEIKENHQENNDELLAETTWIPKQLNEDDDKRGKNSIVKSSDNVKDDKEDHHVSIQRRRSDITVYDDDDDLFFNDDLLIDPIAQMNNAPIEILMKFKEFDIIVEQLRGKNVTDEEKELLKQIVGNELWQLILDEVKRINKDK